MRSEDLFALNRHALRLKAQRLEDLFLADPSRFSRFSRRAGPLLLDISKQKLDESVVTALIAIAETQRLAVCRNAMFGGELINTAEHRAALHTALRASNDSPAPPAIRAEISQALSRMSDIVTALHTNQAESVNLPSGITDVINVGIGGSDLGPRLAVEALRDFHNGKFRIHFLPNVDGGETARLMNRLDPKRTLVILVSKSFTTQETLLNGGVLKHWIAQAYANNTTEAERHFMAVSANLPAVQAFGISSQHTLPMWDWVGGRYSVWSSVGLIVALAIGMPRFREFLTGAEFMDRHFCGAAWRDNLPVLLGLIGIWNRNALQYPSLAVIPYDDRLRELPAYLQQLEMESLGKAVTPTGNAVAQNTVPIVWGSVGTNAQHAFFQALHQGTDVVPVDFIGVIQPAHTLQENHDALLANLLAQSAALMRGKNTREVLDELSGIEQEDAERQVLAQQRMFPGDRPSSTLLLDQLAPYSLGVLLALYEHKVFVQACLWEINAFDQWGVELGKQIAKKILPCISNKNNKMDFDASTCGLLAAIHTQRSNQA